MVDSASLEGNRRPRRAKPERLDVHHLLTMLLRQRAGERQVWRAVRVPRVDDEASWQQHRDRLRTQGERPRGRHRLKGLRAGWGVRLRLHGDGAAQLEQGRQWAGSPLPPALRARRQREGQQAPCLTEQLARLETERRGALRTREQPAVE